MGLSFSAVAADAKDPLVSEARAVAGEEWTYRIQRSAEPWVCGEKKQQHCVEQQVLIHNDSDRTLECLLRVDYKEADGKLLGADSSQALILPHEERRVHGRVTYDDAQLEVRQADCTARAPYQHLPFAGDCKNTMRGKPLETYYPESALVRSLEGPVVVVFTLPTAAGPARDVHVAESSLVPDLDAAAVKFISDQQFTTACPGKTFDMRVRFRLHELRAGGLN